MLCTSDLRSSSVTLPSPYWRGLVLAMLAASACARSDPREFRIAVLAAKGAEFGQASGGPSMEGAEMAAAEINNAGGVRIGRHVYRINLVERSYEPDPAGAIAEAKRLITVDSVHAIVGPQLSEHALAVAPVAEQAGIPMLSPMASNVLLTAHRRYVSRLALLDEAQGTVLAHFARRDLKVARAAVLYDATRSSAKLLSDLFLRTFVSLGGEVTDIEDFQPEERDFRSTLQRMLAKHPEVLLLPNYTVVDTVQIRQARALGFRGQFLGGDTWDLQAMDRTPAVVGAVIVHQWNSGSPDSASVAFVRRFRQRVGHEPRVTAAATYDAVHVLAKAAVRAGTLRGDLLSDSLRTIPRYVGAAATYHFVGTGDPRRGGVLVRIGAERDSVVAVVDVP
jgi:branched-chain amino acid transport system substrate-binding protein